MKKLLSFVFLAFATASLEAANIQWTMSTGAATMRAADGSTVLNGGTAYLILASDLSAIQADIDGGDSFANIIGGYKLDDAAISGGKNLTTQTADSNKIVAGTSYDFQVLIYDADADKFYASTVKSEKAYDPTSSVEEQQLVRYITLGASDLYAARGTATSSASWMDGTKAPTPPDPVPEPATGALALAGVALLFKRRRA